VKFLSDAGGSSFNKFVYVAPTCTVTGVLRTSFCLVTSVFCRRSSDTSWREHRIHI